MCFCVVRKLPISLSITQSNAMSQDVCVGCNGHRDGGGRGVPAAGSAFTYACAYVCVCSVKLQFSQDCFIILLKSEFSFIKLDMFPGDDHTYHSEH